MISGIAKSSGFGGRSPTKFSQSRKPSEGIPAPETTDPAMRRRKALGQVAPFDEYDLFLKNTAGVGPDCAHAKKDCDNVILDRKDISWLEEVQK